MRVAVCQIPVSADPAVNLDRVRTALADAADQRADLAVFPEGTQARFGSDLRAIAEPPEGAFGSGIGETAGKLGIAVVAGIFEPADDGRVHNTTVAFDGTGRLVASYRKIHVFDSFGHRESDLVAPGDEPVVTDLAARGAELIVLPSAWAAGLFKEEHWVTLVRARAIENTVWVAAAGQVPDPGERPTRAPTGIGRSMIVDPMGVTRVDLGPYPGVATAEIDSDLTARIRAEVPCLQHRRPDVFG